MSNNSTQLSFWNPAAEELTSSLQGSLDHAKTSHMQDGKQEFMQTDQDYSLKFSASPMRSMPLAELDPSSCWKTCQQSLLETEELGQELYMESWPKDTLILNRKLYQQSKWEHYTKETDGGVSASPLWLGTPRATIAKRSQDFLKGRTPSPEEFVETHPQKWATPTANPSISASVEALQKEAKRLHPKGFYTLGTQVATMFPTPRASDTEGGIPKNVELKNGTFSRVNKDGVRWGVKLKDAVAHFPTPTVQDAKNNGGPSQFRMNSLPLNAVVQGSLNSRWVSWLMGFPETWCNVDPIGGPKNPKSQESQQESQNESQN